MISRRFFRKRGGVELISLLDETGYRFDEIDEELSISRGTIHDRVAEARGLNLIQKTLAEREGKQREVHKLSFLGSVISEKMREIGLVKSHETFRSAYEQFSEDKETFSDWSTDTEAMEEKFEERISLLRKKKAAENSHPDPDFHY